jgi:hypothetical protein
MRSAVAQTAGGDLIVMGKRKSRRNSEESFTRYPSPTRLASPAKGKERRDKEKEKKRARLSEGDMDRAGKAGSKSKKDRDGMEVDEEPRKAKVRNGRIESREDSPAVSSDGKKHRREDNLPLPPSDVVVKSTEKHKPNDLPSGQAPNSKRVANPAWISSADIAIWIEHRDAVTSLAWNPKNREVLATGSADGTARLWDFAAGAEGRALQTTKKPVAIKHTSIESSKKNVTAVSWHPDGTVLATGKWGVMVNSRLRGVCKLILFSIGRWCWKVVHPLRPTPGDHVLRSGRNERSQVQPVRIEHAHGQGRLHRLSLGCGQGLQPDHDEVLRCTLE